MTKFFLMIYLCSAVTMECHETSPQPQPYDDHWSCMRDGYGKSFEMIYGETSKEVVNEYRFYTKWTCKEENVETI